MKEVYSFTRDKMTKTTNVLKEEYAAIRAGRANPAILDKVKKSYDDEGDICPMREKDYNRYKIRK